MGYCTPRDVETAYGAAFVADHAADAIADACALASATVSTYLEAARVPLIGPDMDEKIRDCATAIAAHRLLWTAGQHRDDVWAEYLGALAFLKRARDGRLPEQVALQVALAEEDHAGQV